ncbi:MAG: hypothetical protein EOP04_00505 [Proteobacteria bacterium]|nr:MAG: hypothetical protein EOP04_00505 [Pseudomonadota bacterium]
MVTVVGFVVKTNKDGEDFVVLELQGEIIMVQSQTTGKFYATAKRCTMSSTFDEAVAASLIGKQMPGNVVKVECEEYELEDKETGEVRTLAYRYEYQPEVVQEAFKVVHIDRAA